jgi:uncharacterized protein (UPF0548 family)
VTALALPAPFIFRALRPSDESVEHVLAALAHAPFTYPDVGATAGALPAGWDHDVTRGVVGAGAAAAERAERAVRRWAMFDLGWVRPHRVDVPQEAGALVAFTARTFGVWTINVCRVVERIASDDGAVRRVGFAYGTLPGHVLAGEERFELTWDRATDAVSFEIRKFSRPSYRIVRWGGALIRAKQHQFSVDAIARIARAVAEDR